MKVENMKSPRSGRDVPNQFIIIVNTLDVNMPCAVNGCYFQSYSSVIAFKPNICHGMNKVLLDEKYWNYSKTTSKYRNIFLGETTKETKKKIASGEYILRNLN